MQKGAKIGWIGTGVMGKSMAGHIMKKGGHPLSVFNVPASNADSIVKMGATFQEAKQMAQEVDYLFLMVGYPHDVQNVVLHPDTGIINYMRPGSYFIDHTTSTPTLAMKIAEEMAKKQIKAIDAPVSGGDVGAQNGCLVTMVGGEKEHVDHVRPLLDLYSAEVSLMGGPGAGQHTKAANQIMIANNLFGVCEALIYGHKSGLDLDQMTQLLDKGAAGSFQLRVLSPRMLKRDFAPGFYVEHFVKDLGIALGECKEMGIALPGMAQASQFFQAYVAQGGSKDGTQGLLQVLEKMNNTEIKDYSK